MQEDQFGRPPYYLPNPSTIWQPSFPFLERHLTPTPLGLLTWSLRFLRLSWLLFLLPLHILLVTLSLYFPSLLSFFAVPPSLIPGSKRTTWTPSQRYIYPLISRFVWSIAGTGGNPPLNSPIQERSVPLSSRWLEWLAGNEALDIRQEDVKILEGEEGMEWIKGEAVDPRGEVKLVEVPCFWLEVPKKIRSKMKKEEGVLEEMPDLKVKEGAKRARDGEKVIMLLAGGGYIQGSAVQTRRAYDLARETGLKVFGVNYRKASSPENAFPAALQDAIVAYSHLVLELGYKDITLAGDSAGAGLSVTLLLYLTTTLATSPNPPSNLILPSSLILYSPWLDLTLSTLSHGTPLECQDDLVNRTMLNWASQQYLSNLYGRPFDKLQVILDDYETSPYALRARHPFFSPALESSIPTLEIMAACYKGSSPLRILVISGDAEIFATETRRFVRNLKGLGENVKVDWVEEVDEVHVFMLLPGSISPAAKRAMRRVKSFMSY